MIAVDDVDDRDRVKHADIARALALDEISRYAAIAAAVLRVAFADLQSSQSTLRLAARRFPLRDFSDSIWSLWGADVQIDVSPRRMLAIVDEHCPAKARRRSAPHGNGRRGADA
jgi:hypothetical protein